MHKLITLPRTSNQARLLADYAINFMKNGNPSIRVQERLKQFHTDSVICAMSALALKTTSPTILYKQARKKQSTGAPTKPKADFAKLFGPPSSVPIEYAIAANIAATSEWYIQIIRNFKREATGTHQLYQQAHQDYYPVVMAAAQQFPSISGSHALKAMVLSDEIRGRLAQAFAKCGIDHVVHGAIASICTYGALLGAAPQEIESAIGMFVSHYVPSGVISNGTQQSPSKSASAALSTEVAIKCLQRAMEGFQGQTDIFRQPQSPFSQRELNNSSFSDISLQNQGDDFALMQTHFKLGMYNFQFAGALEAIQKLILNK